VIFEDEDEDGLMDDVAYQTLLDDNVQIVIDDHVGLSCCS
jgi:hypothetical protein